MDGGFKISFCVGVHNEREILKSSLKELLKGLKEECGSGNYEVILVDNGSTDGTDKILSTIRNRNVKAFYVEKRGLGLAYRTSIIKARYNKIILSAIDLPFGFSDLKQFKKVKRRYDIIFGSKAHPDSVVLSPRNRRVSSFIYSMLVRNLFGVKIGDTQGSIMLKKDKIIPFLSYCDADNAFFTAQLAIYSSCVGLKIGEVSVKMSKDSVKRRSRFSIVGDGSKMLTSLINEYRKFGEVKDKLK